MPELSLAALRDWFAQQQPAAVKGGVIMPQWAPPRTEMGLSRLGDAQGADWSRYNQPFGEIGGNSPEDTPVAFQTRNGVRITEGDIQRGMDVGMGAATVGGPTKGIRAYHGSPHDFDRFDLSKIGTGEGAQAYGHGLYFAERPGTAEFYRSQLAGEPDISMFRMGDMRLGLHNQFDYTKRAHVNTMENIKSSLAEDVLIDQAGLVGASDKKKFVLDLLDSKIADYKDSWPEGIKDAMALRQQIDRLGVDLKMGKRPGSTYEVNINADPAKFLNFDAPLSQQSKAVQDIFPQISKPHEYRIEPSASGKTWSVLHPGGWVPNGAKSFYKSEAAAQAAAQNLNVGRKIADLVPRTPEQSGMFREAGIPGIKYLDQMSRDANAGSSNYVVFDDKLIDIMRKYGLAGIAPLAGAGAVAGQQQAQPQM